MRKTAATTLILICLMTLGVVCIQSVKAQYQGNITINADGSVTPSTAPIQQSGNIYTLTSDVTGSITLNRNNTIFDGNGYTLLSGGAFDSLDQGDGLSIGGNNVPFNQQPSANLVYTSNVTVVNFIVTGSVFGIALDSTSNVIVANNTISGTGNGIQALDEPTAGIYIFGGGSNIITGNNVANNYNAMSFVETQNNLIVGNNITDNNNPYVTVSSVMFWGASNNTIYHNNFINNTSPAAGDSSYNSPSSINTWDDGYPGGGNYWSDYQTKYPNTSQIDSSGIGNMPYVLDSQNKDQYPLMEPFTASFLLNYEQEVTPPKISVLSPLNQTYSTGNVTLAFSVDKPVNWVGYSLDGQQNITITGNTTITNMTNGSHTLTVYANDTYGDVGASQTITFIIALTTFPPATVAAISGAAVIVVVVAGLLVYFKKHKR